MAISLNCFHSKGNENLSLAKVWLILMHHCLILMVSIEVGVPRSHNHPMNGGYDEWFFRGIAGVHPIEKIPGVKRMELQPYFTSNLKSADIYIPKVNHKNIILVNGKPGDFNLSENPLCPGYYWIKSVGSGKYEQKIDSEIYKN